MKIKTFITAEEALVRLEKQKLNIEENNISQAIDTVEKGILSDINVGIPISVIIGACSYFGAPRLNSKEGKKVQDHFTALGYTVNVKLLDGDRVSVEVSAQ